MNKLWRDFKELTSKCYLSMIQPDIAMNVWDEAFQVLEEIVTSGREENRDFAPELYCLDEVTDFQYQVEDWVDDYLTETDMREQYEKLQQICEKLMKLFRWEEVSPADLNFRIAAALGAQGKNEEAVSFCEAWYEQDRNSILSATALIYAKLGAQDVEGAGAVIGKYITEDTQCTLENDILCNAALLFYQVSGDEKAAERMSLSIQAYEKEVEESLAGMEGETFDFNTFLDEVPFQ